MHTSSYFNTKQLTTRERSSYHREKECTLPPTLNILLLHTDGEKVCTPQNMFPTHTLFLDMDK